MPVLVDVSRSMRLDDADGQTRLARATGLLRTEPRGRRCPDSSRPSSTRSATVSSPHALEQLAATAARATLNGALAAIRERYRGQPARRHRPAYRRRRYRSGRRRRGAGVGRAGVCRSAGIARPDPRPRGHRRDGWRSAAGSSVGRSARVRGEFGVRPGAVSASRAGERPEFETAASCRRRMARRSRRCSRSRRTRRARPCTPSRFPPTSPKPSPRTTRAACSSIRPAASADSSSSKAHRDSSTAS